MDVAALLTTAPGDALEKAGARWILKDFSELPRELEAALL
jgi:hypothetical protein